MELSIEVGLKNIKDFWAEMNLTMDPYKDLKNIYRLKAVDDIFQALEENMVYSRFLRLVGILIVSYIDLVF